MVIKKFIFAPDGHYGYPESIQDQTTPWKRGELVEAYTDASYGPYMMNGGGDTEQLYNDYGDFTVYHNFYIMMCNPEISPDDILGPNFDADDVSSAHSNFMKDASETDGVSFIISIGKISEVVINKSNTVDKQIDLHEIDKIVAGHIIKEYRNKNIKAGLLYQDIVPLLPGIEKILASELSDEEMNGLKNTGKGGSLLRRFGLDD